MTTTKTKVKVTKQNVGVDISKDDFKVCFYHLDSNNRRFIKGTRRFKNTLAGFVDFMKWIEKKRKLDLILHITMEATGVYYENLAHFLNDNGYHVSVVLPNQSKAYAKSLNLNSKTDKIDANMLGQLGIERELGKWQPASAKMRVLKQLTRDRGNLIEEKVAISNKIHAQVQSFSPDKTVIKRMEERLDLLKKQIKQVEKQVELTIKTDELINHKIDNICKVKGLALITVATIIAETNGFVLFTSRSQLINYSGYDVIEWTSGTSLKGQARISKKGNSRIRKALHFPAISAVKHEPQFQQLFDRILDRTSIKMKGYVAVQRKLLLLIYTLFKKDSVYDPNYLQNKENIQNCRQDKDPAYSG